MASTKQVAVKADLAHKKAMEVIENLGSAERVDNLNNIGIMATTKRPEHLMAAQAEMLVALAEIVAEQDARIAKLEAAAAKASPGGTRKSGAKK